MTDLMAPPTPDELAKVQKAPKQDDLMAPPTHEEIKAAQDSKLSPLESGISGLAQGLTFGYGDEIIGGARALGAKALDKIGVKGFEAPIGDLYRKYRDEQRAHVDQAKIENPWSFIGGSVAGAIASPVGKVLAPAQGAGTLANIGRATAGGALAGSGLSEADMTNPDKNAAEFASDTAKGAALGAVTQAGFSLLGKAANAVKPSSLRSFAAEKAVKAAGAMKRDFNELGPERVQELGKDLLDKKVVTALASLEDVAQRASAQKEQAGEAIGKALSNVDDLVTTGKQMIDNGELFPGLPEAGKQKAKDMLDQHFQFNMGRIGQRIEDEIIKPNATNPLLKGEMAKLQGIADDFKNSAAQTLKEGNVIKGTQGRITKFESDTVPNAFKKEVYDVIKTELDDVVAKTGNLEAGINGGSGGNVAGRNQSVSDAYQAAKKTYGGMKTAEDMATNRLGAQQSNRTISLTDTIAGVGGLAGGGPIGGLAMGVGNKLIRKYGDSVAAVGAQKAAETLERAPVLLGKFAGVLDEAIKRGTLPSTHLELMKDPDYRRIIDNLEKGAIQRRLQGGN